jgi:CRISPR-associated exonuclease Cas4
VNDDESLPLSALQHWAHCPRQCGLIHLKRAFDDNLHTLPGNAVHAQVDHPGFELRRGPRVERALPLFSNRLGQVGKADTVEFEDGGRHCPVCHPDSNVNWPLGSKRLKSLSKLATVSPW